MLAHEFDYDDYRSAKAEANWARREARKLKRRAHLDYHDPDALSDEEIDLLEDLEEWEP